MPGALRCVGRAVYSTIGLLMRWTERRGQQFLGKYCNYKTNCPAAGLAREQGGWRGPAQVRRAPGFPTDVRQLEVSAPRGARSLARRRRTRAPLCAPGTMPLTLRCSFCALHPACLPRGAFVPRRHSPRALATRKGATSGPAGRSALKLPGAWQRSPTGLQSHHQPRV